MKNLIITLFAVVAMSSCNENEPMTGGSGKIEGVHEKVSDDTINAPSYSGNGQIDSVHERVPE